jgi:diguanylate cyclase (GGDEF)-like protein
MRGHSDVDALRLAAHAGAPQRSPWVSVASPIGMFVLAAASGAVGAVPLRSFGVLFVLAFAWIGLHHRRVTTLLLVPAQTLAYVIGVALGASGSVDLRDVVLTTAVCALVGSTISRHVERIDHSVAAFRVVSSVGGDLHGVDAGEMLERVVRAITDLGYDGAGLGVIDTIEDTFRVDHATGSLRALRGAYPSSSGMCGAVREAGEPVVVDDYQSFPHAVPAVRAAGVRTCIGVPVFADGELAGVLIATSRRRRTIRMEDVDTLVLLAQAAGSAFEAIEVLQLEQRANRELRHIATTDPLTGVGNRLIVEPLLLSLGPDDSLALLDLDHFKRVNDEHGHPRGDALLVAVANHLRTQLRDCDHVARYGGEEFFVVLPGTTETRARAIVDRVRRAWNITCPLTTFSAGVAGFDGTPSDTLNAADRALYAAKASGRNAVLGASSVLARS